MEPVLPTTLYLLCGKIASGKSTLAREIASRPRTLLISLDDWMSTVYPVENQSIEDFIRLTARLRSVFGPHITDILRQEVSVVLDFPANTTTWRAWMRSIFSAAGVRNELHFLDVPDDICKARLRERNASKQHQYNVDEATFELFTRYFEVPKADEGFKIIVHSNNVSNRCKIEG